MKAKLFADRHFPIGEVDRRLFGSFLEHLGRAVYGGIYEPEHPAADEMGFRRDVLEMVKKLGVPVVRYPGGNFVSGYCWEDGTGPREQRPRRMELAWSTVETNQVGIDEFQQWAKLAGADVMMAVNLGTRGVEEAKNLLEYCNFPGGTKYSEQRRANGFAEPFGIKYWCLGNEMDGPWQIGHKTAREYARLAAETGRVMKMMDPSVELVVCGSSNSGMPTFVDWEETVLNETYDIADYISLHSYYGNPEGDSRTFLACSRDMDKFITTVAAVCDVVKQRKRSDKTMMLSFDEWNVWYHSAEQDKTLPKWVHAPHQLEDVYDFQDALLVGSMLITLLRHADRVKMACLAQLVNVIAPIMTENGGRCWAQTIFYPFMDASRYGGRGTSLRTAVECDTYDAGQYGQTPYLEAIALADEESRSITVFAVNRSLEEEMELSVSVTGYGDLHLLSHTLLHCDDLKAVNTADSPDTVQPRELPVEDTVVLPPQSWNVLRFAY